MRLAWALLAVVACGPADPPEGRGEPWPEADAMFHRDTRFLGADGAYTVDLGEGRILWLFGDTLVARTAGSRDGAYFLRNSVAVQTGRDPTRAFLQWHWRSDGDDTPSSFFPEPDAQHWFWPGAGIRLEGTLLLFGGMLRNEGPAGPESFRDDRAMAYRIPNPDDDPDRWTLQEVAVAPAEDNLGEAVVVDGDWVYVYGNVGGRHAPFVLRYTRAQVVGGDLTQPEIWCGDGYRAGCAPATLFDLGDPEYSVHFDARMGAYVYVGTSGYGATTLSWRTAPRPEGPWSGVGDVYRPVESFMPDAFVYAGKAHPELDGGGALVATYVPSSFVDLPRSTDDRFYYPHFVRIFPR